MKLVKLALNCVSKYIDCVALNCASKYINCLSSFSETDSVSIRMEDPLLENTSLAGDQNAAIQKLNSTICTFQQVS